MKHILPGLLLLAACSNAEIPPIELGATGARFMDGRPRDPLDAYLQAYANLSPQHLRVRKNLEPREQNLYGARVAMETIIACLERMRSLVTPASQSRFDPYLARYRDFLKEISQNTWGGSFLQDLDRSEQEIKTRFNPERVEIGEAADPAAAKPAPKPPEPPPAEPPVRTSPPAEKPSAPAEPPGPKPGEKAAPPPGDAVSLRLLFKAWDRAHEELVEAVKAKKDGRAKYGDVAEALGHMKRQLPADRAAKLQIYIDYYADLDAKTKGFTTLPEKTTSQDIVDDLNVASRVIRKEFNPEK